MFYRFLIIALLSIGLTQGQDESASVNTSDLKSMKEKLEYEFKSLESQDKDFDFEKSLEDLGKRSKQYIRFRKEECSGEFATIIIDKSGQSVAKKNKLSPVETKLCMLELINFQRRYSNVIFDLRRKLMLKQHQEQLLLLEKYRQQSIDELEKMAAGYR